MVGITEGGDLPLSTIKFKQLVDGKGIVSLSLEMVVSLCYFVYGLLGPEGLLSPPFKQRLGLMKVIDS